MKAALENSSAFLFGTIFAAEYMSYLKTLPTSSSAAPRDIVSNSKISTRELGLGGRYALFFLYLDSLSELGGFATMSRLGLSKGQRFLIRRPRKHLDRSNCLSKNCLSKNCRILPSLFLAEGYTEGQCGAQCGP